MSQMAVLEATIAACIMISAATFVATYAPPDAAVPIVDALLLSRGKEIISVFAETPPLIPSCGASSALEELLVEALDDKDEIWSSRIGRLVPPGVEASLYLSNGLAELPLHVRQDSKGITSTRMLALDSPSSVLVADAASYGGTAAFAGASLGTFFGRRITVAGEAIRTSVVASDGAGQERMVVWTPTALAGPVDRGQGVEVQNFSLEAPDGQKLVRRVSPIELQQNQAISLLVNLSLLSETSTTTHVLLLSLHVPPEWQIDLDVFRAQGWSIESERRNELGETILQLSHIPRARHFALQIETSPPRVISRPFDTFTAYLGNGSLGQSTLVVQYPVAAERELPMVLYPTTPYPLRPDGVALFGVALANGGPTQRITQVDLEVPGGYDLARHGGAGAKLFRQGAFEEFEEVDDGNWSWVDGRHVQWRGNRTVEASTATSWVVGVPIAGADQATSVEGPRSDGVVSRLTFGNGFVSESRAWGNAPGLIRHRVPPQVNLSDGTVVSEGYPWFPYGGEFPVAVEVRGAAASLSGRTSYRSAPEGSDLARAEDALMASRFQVSSRMAPLGSTVRVEANFESLVETLADAGATEVEVSVALHAPPSIGCEPTMTWRADAGSLPLGEVRALRLWAPEGVPALFSTGDDGKAHRADAVGAPRWSRALGAAGTALATGVAGPLREPVLLVGDAHGGVRALAPLTGVERWNASLVAAGVPPGPPDTIVALRVDEAAGVAFAASAGGRVEARDLASGSLVAGWGAPSTVVSAERLPDGRALVLTPTRLWLRDAALGPLADAPVSSPRWLTVTGAGAFVTGGGATTLFALDGLFVVRQEAHAEGAALAAAADADLDGVVDHVVALSGGELRVFDGADGRVLRWGRPDVSAKAPRDVDATFVAARALTETACRGASGATYREPGCDWAGAPVEDALSGRVDASARTPLFLGASSRGVVLAWKDEATPVLEQRDAAGNLAWWAAIPPSAVPTAAASGPWSAGESLALAEADGRISVRRAGEAAEYDRVATSGFTGSFGFAMRVPEGGFFGTHLLVATLAWEVDGVAQEARLAEWFEVVNPDGSPNLHPAYRVVLVLQDLSDPRGG